MQRMCVVLCALFVVGASTAFGQSNWFARWNHHYHVVKERNTYWPEPFVEADRMSVEDPFRLMVQNGWKRQNLMSSHHFDGGRLNEAGRIRAQRLISQSPVEYRTIFVERSLDPQETHERVASVQNWAQKVTRGDHVPVHASDMTPIASEGDRLDAINRKADAAIPEPRMPASSGTLTGA
jgi:hypothetical protein